MSHIKLYEPKKLIKKLTELAEKREYVRIEFKDAYLIPNASGFIALDKPIGSHKKYKFKLTYPYLKEVKISVRTIETVAVMAYIDGYRDGSVAMTQFIEVGQKLTCIDPKWQFGGGGDIGAYKIVKVLENSIWVQNITDPEFQPTHFIKRRGFFKKFKACGSGSCI